VFPVAERIRTHVERGHWDKAKAAILADSGRQAEALGQFDHSLRLHAGRLAGVPQSQFACG
jgi:hypothetical protein